MQEEDFDLLEAVDITDEALDEWELKGKDFVPTPPSEPTPVSGHKCMVALTKITGTVLRLLYGMKSEMQTPQKLAESVCYLDSLLNACESSGAAIRDSDKVAYGSLTTLGLATVPEHLRWNPAEQDPKYLSQTAGICEFASHLPIAPLS